jgi:putative hydrolase of the HAD superfamily
MIIIFDLDDTLYPEIDFVIGGLKEVSNFLEEKYGLESNMLFNEMKSDLNLYGRGSIFNNALKKHKIFSVRNLKKCIAVYRSHNPKIKLYPEAENCLLELKEYRKYIVTDGNTMVQRKKINALGIKHLFVKTIPTYQYGLNFGKPSVLTFQKIMKLENCHADKLVYIGDNPNKDFVNIKKIGVRTVRVLTGVYKDLIKENEFESEFKFENLNDLTIEFIKKLNNEN